MSSGHNPEEIRASLQRSLAPFVTIHKALKEYTLNSCGRWPLHKMSITPNIIMICIDMQGDEHHCLEEQGNLGVLGGESPH
jgi:hypothetical protein